MFFGRFNIKTEYRDGEKDPRHGIDMSFSEARAAVHDILETHRVCGNTIERINWKQYNVLIDGKNLWGTITIERAKR